MDETQMILALRALRELLDNGDRDDGDELVASYRALGKAIVKNKPMTGKDRTRVARYLREAAKQPAGTCHGMVKRRLTVRVHRQCGFSPRRDYSYRAGVQPCVHAYR